MPIYDNDGNELSPCVCSKAVFALELKEERPTSITPSTQDYWAKVVKRIAELNNIDNDQQLIENAIGMYNDLFIINSSC